MMLQRVNLVTSMDPYVGKYFSIDFIRRQILQQTEKEMKEIDKQMKSDIDSGMALNPVDMNNMDLMDRQNSAMSPEIQGIQSDDSFEREMQKSNDAHDKQKDIMKSQPKPQKSSSNK